MSAADLERRAIERIEQAVADDEADRRVVHCEAESDWDPGLLRTVSEHELHVLQRGADLIVFYEGNGEFTGWRDEGRRGAPQARTIDPATLLGIVVAELELPPASWLEHARPAELRPVGWTHEATVRAGDLRVRAWVAPETLCVIQCLYETAGDAARVGATNGDDE